MTKNVYSLVLTDDVVREIDRIAFQSGGSRSSVINEILAEHVRYTTPEKRMREVFGEMEQLLTQAAFEPMLQPSETMYSLRSSLAYKYNPSVRYSVELYKNALPLIGELRVSVRSQNSVLTLTMLQFFKLWAKLEQSYLGRAECALEDGRFCRKLRLPDAEYEEDEKAVSHKAIGQAISDYISALDAALKAYFAHVDEPSAAISAVERIYAERMAKAPIIL